MFKPILDRVLVKRIVEEEKEGQIILLEHQKIPSNKGEVIEVGSQVKTVNKSDVVLFDLHGVNKIMLEGEEHLLMSESNLIAVFE